MLNLEHMVCGPLGNNVFVLWDENSRECVVIDPGLDCGEAVEFIDNNHLVVKHILLTHGHFDHAHSVADLTTRYQTSFAVHRDDLDLLGMMKEHCSTWGMPLPKPLPEPGMLLEDGQIITVGNSTIEVMHTPGHSAGQVAFITEGKAFVGDTLFWRAIGRYDLPGSNYDDLAVSIKDKLFSLPGETVVWPGHGQMTTIDEERRLNPYFGENARFSPLD